MIIYPVTHDKLLDSPEWEDLEKEYALECSLPELGKTDPQRMLYAALEASGGLQCFGVYDKSLLVGFISLLMYILPHYGKKIAVTESIFLSPFNRNGWNGIKMLDFTEDYSRSKGCVSVEYIAPVGSQFAKLLAKRDGCRHSNQVFIRSL